MYKFGGWGKDSFRNKMGKVLGVGRYMIEFKLKNLFW